MRFRLLLAVHTVLWLVLLGATRLVTPAVPAYLWLLVVLPGMWLALDALAVWPYWRRVRLVLDTRQSPSYLFFFGKTDLLSLRHVARAAEGLINDMAAEADWLPEGERRRAIMGMLRKYGRPMTRNLLSERKQEIRLQKRMEEEQRQKEAHRARLAEELSRRAASLGVGTAVDKLIAGDRFDEARSAIAEREERERLLRRADCLGCRAVVEKSFPHGNETAQASLLRAEKLIGDARALGIEKIVREHLDRGRLDLAEDEVGRRNAQAELQDRLAGFRQQVEDLRDEELRSKAEAALRNFKNATKERERRMAEHVLRLCLASSA